MRRSATVPPFDAEHGCKQRSRGTRIIKVDGILERFQIAWLHPWLARRVSVPAAQIATWRCHIRVAAGRTPIFPSSRRQNEGPGGCRQRPRQRHCDLSGWSRAKTLLRRRRNVQVQRHHLVISRRFDRKQCLVQRHIKGEIRKCDFGLWRAGHRRVDPYHVPRRLVTPDRLCHRRRSQTKSEDAATV